MIEPNKQYAGPHNARRMVLSVDGGTVTYLLPISQQQHQCSLAEFEAWAVGEYVDPFAGA